MSKIDFKKENKELYSPSAKEVTLVEVPEMNFLMIDGKGDPNTSQDYQTAIEALNPDHADRQMVPVAFLQVQQGGFSRA